MHKTTQNNNVQGNPNKHGALTPATDKSKTADQPAHHINHPTSNCKTKEASMRKQHREKQKRKKLTLRPLKHNLQKSFKPN